MASDHCSQVLPCPPLSLSVTINPFITPPLLLAWHCFRHSRWQPRHCSSPILQRQLCRFHVDIVVGFHTSSLSDFLLFLSNSVSCFRVATVAAAIGRISQYRIEPKQFHQKRNRLDQRLPPSAWVISFCLVTLTLFASYLPDSAPSSSPIFVILFAATSPIR